MVYTTPQEIRGKGEIISTPYVKFDVGTIPELPSHKFPLLKIIEKEVDKQGRETHYLSIYLEHWVEDKPVREKLAQLVLKPADNGEEAPTLDLKLYLEKEH